MNTEIMLNAARNIRKEFEARTIDRSLLRNLYQNYNHMSGIDSFLYQAERMFPKLNCGLAALYLQYRLNAGSIIKGSYGDQRHTFLLVENDLIVDITADQFGGPEMYVGPLRHPWNVVG